MFTISSTKTCVNNQITRRTRPHNSSYCFRGSCLLELATSMLSLHSNYSQARRVSRKVIMTRAPAIGVTKRSSQPLAFLLPNKPRHQRVDKWTNQTSLVTQPLLNLLIDSSVTMIAPPTHVTVECQLSSAIPNPDSPAVPAQFSSARQSPTSNPHLLECKGHGCLDGSIEAINITKSA